MTQPNITHEIKRNLLGGLEVALFMRVARERFGNTKGEALRSFLIPVLFLPLTIFTLYMYPNTELPEQAAGIMALLYCLRMVAVWVFFFGIVYWITAEVDRKTYFYKFVIASNWLSVPATVCFLPVLWMIASGAYSWAELYPFMMCLMFYTYAFTAFMASYVLRIPWELAGFIVFISMCVNNSTLDMYYWVGSLL